MNKEFVLGERVYSLRPVGRSDLEWIYRLMNDRRVRKNSFNSKPFSMKDHLAYWKKKLRQKGFKAVAIWFGEEPVGLLRFENKEVSIGVFPKFWGTGIGFGSLSQFDLSGFVARMKVGNRISFNLFNKLGFVKDEVVVMRKGVEK